MTLIIAITAFIASLLTLFSGFGLGTLLMPVVAIFFPVVTAIALTALVHLLNNLFKLTTFWRDINWSVSFKFGIPALLATIPGAWLLTHLSEMTIINQYQIFGINAVITPAKLTVGLLLILFAFIEWFSFAKKVNISAKYLPWGGVLSGFFGGFSGNQGAFRSMFLLHVGLNPQQFIATNTVIAVLVDLIRLTVYGFNISLLLEQVDISLIAIASIAAFAGVFVGKIGVKKVTIGFIQNLVAIMLLLLGTLMTVGII